MKWKKENKPPWLFEWLLKKTSNREEDFSISGDFEEIFQSMSRDVGLFRARLWYIVQVLKTVSIQLLSATTRDFYMLKNYLKIALRNITRTKVYSFINIFGLAVGISCFILIAIYAQYELSFDRYHDNSERIFRVAQVLREGHAHEGNNLFAGSPMPLAPLLEKNFPEVVRTTRFTNDININLTIEDRSFFESELYYFDSNVFRIFSFTFLSGDAETALEAPFSVVLTQSGAEKYFGSTDVMGKTVRYDNKYDFTVTGVIENIPENSHFTFDVMFSYKTLENHPDEQYRNWLKWGGPSGYTYLLLEQNTDIDSFNSKIYDFLKTTEANRDGTFNKLFIQSLTDIHLYSKLDAELSINNDFRTIVLISIIAIIILMIACINYMNITTAQSSFRIKEVGIRKVFGAQKKQLARQFLTETFLVTFFAMIVAILIVKIALPYYNLLIERQFQFELLQNFKMLMFLILLTVLISLIAGSYPAIYISSFKPVLVLKNIFHKGTRGKSLKNFLVTFQFAISVTLIICTIVVRDQLLYINNTHLGYDRDNLVVVRLVDDRFRSEKHKLEVIKSELVKHADISNVSSSSSLPNRIIEEVLVQKPGERNTPMFEGDESRVDINFVDLYGIKILEGRGFSREFPSDNKGTFIINETAAKMLGWENPVNRELVRGTNIKGKIIGVMKDFNAHSMYQPIGPVHLWFQEPLLYQQHLTVRVSGRNTSEVINYIKYKFNEVAPNYRVDYQFFDEIYNNMYKSENKLEMILTLFSLLGIILSCLGLFGFSSITLFSRIKEIGIRKVCGASTWKIVFLISKDFIRLVLIANIISWPIAWFLMNSWLSNFAFRTSIDSGMFFLTGLVTILISLAAISYQAVKTSLTNPVDILRYE